MAGLLSKERTIAKPGFNRWLVPPAALAIHLCIGMAYGFSGFWLPLRPALWGCTRPGHANPSPRPGLVHHELRLDPVRPGLDVYAVLRPAWRVSRHLGWLARTRRSAPGGRGRGFVLGRRGPDLGGWGLPTPGPGGGGPARR